MSKHVSDSFSIEPRRYVATVASRYLWRYGWLGIPPIAAVLALALTDIRFVYVALMLLFVAYPMMLMLIYYSYAFKPQAIKATLAHHIEYDEEGIKVVYDEDHPLAVTDNFKWSDINGYEDKGNRVLLTIFKNKPDQFIALPQNAMDTDRWQALFDIIDSSR